MKYLKLLFLLPLFSLLSACGTTKKTEPRAETQETRPDWIRSKPVSSLYYTGVGMARKRPGESEAHSRARSQALHDLAGEISVEISSESMLYQLEQHSRVSQDFRSTVRTLSRENLEGYELVDNYENGNEIWVYYRLSKEKYNRIKEERKRAAISSAKSLLEDSEKDPDFKGAFIKTVEALATVQEYLGEPLLTDYRGKDVYLGHELHDRLRDLMNGLSITPAKDEVTVKRGEKIPGELTTFNVLYKNKAVANLPMHVRFSGGRIQNRPFITDRKGDMRLETEKISTHEPVLYLEASPDLHALVKKSAQSGFVHTLIDDISAPGGRMRIFVDAPHIYIRRSERNLGEVMSSHPLSNAYEGKFSSEGYLVTDNIEEADYIVEIESDTREGGVNNDFHTVNLDATVRMTDAAGKQLYKKQITGIRGVQLNYQKAGWDAYSKAAREVNDRYFRELVYEVFM